MTTAKPTPHFEQIIEAAESIADEREDGYVGVEHLMLAICADPDTVPTQELVELGYDPAVITAALDTTMRSESFNTPSYRYVFLDGTVVDHGPP